MKSAPRVSIAIPVFNEEENLAELLRRVRAVVDALPGGPHEILFADDGSSDRTLEILEAESNGDPRVGAVSLSRNFGHQAALTAALDHVHGDVVVVMDGDLQDAPETIPSLLAKYAEGFDVVYAIRVQRKEGLLLRLSYGTFYRLAAAVSSLRLPLGAGDFGLMSRRVVAELRRTQERHRYLRGLRTWVGFRQTGIEVERQARSAGSSKYSVRGLFKLAFDGIFAFSVVPIRIAMAVGLVALVLSSLFGIYALYAKLFLDRSPQGFTALILVVVFMAGVQLLFLGVIGEYIGRIYDEVKGRPVYIVARRIGAAEESSSSVSDAARVQR
ncbi:MAG: glycosyltransferase family 2 protein [Thermoanaerobaculia bacterium]